MAICLYWLFYEEGTVLKENVRKIYFVIVGIVFLGECVKHCLEGDFILLFSGVFFIVPLLIRNGKGKRYAVWQKKWEVWCNPRKHIFRLLCA